MKNFLFTLFIVISHQAMAQPVPFYLQLEPVDAPALPFIHSYAKAQRGSQWLVVAGRIDGLHSLFPAFAFSVNDENTNLMVIDTNNWNVWQVPVSLLPYGIRMSLSATNVEYKQVDDVLYVVGGYAYDSIADNKITFPTLTALDVDEVMNEIVQGTNNLLPYIRQITDSNLAVTGGRMETIGNTFYLVGGQDFSGLYTKTNDGEYVQYYTNSISSFQLDDDGVNLTVTDFTPNIDTVNFHRRDLNTAPWISPAGEVGFGLYGGVFQYEHNLPYQNPVYQTASGTTIDFSFEQKMSQYACPVIPLFDSVTNEMYTLFIGGISLYYFDSVTQQLTEDTLVPFIRDVSALIHHADGSSDEVILPVQLPERGEANAEFFADASVPAYSNGVFRLRQLTGPTVLGFIYGGITSSIGNDGITQGSNKVYRVKLIPDFSLGISQHPVQPFMLTPDPANEAVTIALGFESASSREVVVLDALGHQVMHVANENNAGLIRIGTSGLPAGMYVVVIRCADAVYSAPLVVMH